MPDLLHKAFCIEHTNLAPKLISPVTVVPVSTHNESLRYTPVKINAIWDTGAMSTVITPALKERFELFTIDTKVINSAIGKAQAGVSEVSITLPSGIEIPFRRVLIADFKVPDIDMLIGMDIITLGDFTICNSGGKTLFSFALPPFPDKINLVAKANQCAE